MRFAIIALLLLASQTALAQTARIERVAAIPEEEAGAAQRMARRFDRIVRDCFARGGEGDGSGRVDLRAVLREGRPVSVALASREGHPAAQAVQCSLGAFRARLRGPADSPIRELRISIRFDYPEPTLPEHVMEEARVARRRARCLREGADDLIAAIRSFERSSGRARRRAHARVLAARAALTACDESSLLRRVLEGEGGSGVDTTCPTCRSPQRTISLRWRLRRATSDHRGRNPTPVAWGAERV